MINNHRLLAILKDYELPPHFLKAISDDNTRNGGNNENKPTNPTQLEKEQAKPIRDCTAWM